MKKKFIYLQPNFSFSRPRSGLNKKNFGSVFTTQSPAIGLDSVLEKKTVKRRNGKTEKRKYVKNEVSYTSTLLLFVKRSLQVTSSAIYCKVN